MSPVHYYWIVLWTSIETTLGIIGACLPTLRTLFSGLSPESIIRSIRSQFSLHSLRSPKGSPKGSHKSSRNGSPLSGPQSESHERFAHSDEAPEDSGIVDNRITGMELQDRIQAVKDRKGDGIHISRDFHQRTEDMV